MKQLLALVLALAVVTSVKALSIQDFDQMSSKDSARYLTSLLKGTVEGLEQHGNKQDADRLYKLFTEGDGLNQFVKQLHIFRALEKNKSAEHSGEQPRYQVEEVFAVTLKQNGITVPLKFLLGINKDFKATSGPADK
jgi:hypothetical protein